MFPKTKGLYKRAIRIIMSLEDSSEAPNAATARERTGLGVFRDGRLDSTSTQDPLYKRAIRIIMSLESAGLGLKCCRAFHP
jgi:hypothetical protein